jgi:hypothetical protein
MSWKSEGVSLRADNKPGPQYLEYMLYSKHIPSL